MYERVGATRDESRNFSAWCLMKRGEHIWSLCKNGKQVDCELRFDGESYEREVQFLHDVELA